ncbi:Retrotransposon-derived protein PEG10 [Labeo rohita]|uniref:Retrotransposon-derived protein PEG10 n=1 Tax=Labeo rohita TaxID=84645 RepID=A0ABQ8LU39_LABRO|nr:Retrotransposon-derived protein PEG10 [Labeo rohita]
MSFWGVLLSLSLQNPQQLLKAFTTATSTRHVTSSTAHPLSSFTVWSTVHIPYVNNLDSSWLSPYGLTITAQLLQGLSDKLIINLSILAFHFTILSIKLLFGFAPYLCLWSHPCCNVTEDQTDTEHEHRSTCCIPSLQLVYALKAGLWPCLQHSLGMRLSVAFFLLQVNLYIQMQPERFSSESAKVAFLISLLTGKALQWAKAIWNSNNNIINSFEQFTSHFSEVFSTAASTLTTSDQLFRLCQGTSSVNEYTIHFHMLALASGWNEVALLSGYRQGLNPEIRAAMALYDDSTGLESFLQRTTRVSQRLATCQPPVTTPQPASVAACFPVPEPMQVDTTCLSRAERNHCRSSGLCLYCGNQGHLIRNCPIRPPRPVEDIRFLVLEDSTVSVILGCPWLYQHIPDLRWDPCDIICWNEQCYDQCLSNLPLPRSIPVHLASTQVESPEPEFSPGIQADKQVATHLPHHRPWDCAIKLLPGAELPKGRIYPLSIPERQAMEEYIAEALKQGFIQPFTSPTASSFFFVGKKDGARGRVPQRALWSQNLYEAAECGVLITSFVFVRETSRRRPSLHSQGTTNTG